MDQEKTKVITLETIDDINGCALPYNLLLSDKTEVTESNKSRKVTKIHIDKILNVPVEVVRFRKSIVRIKV